MIENKAIIDKQGNIIEKCVSFNDNVPQFFKMKDNYIVVKVLDKNYIKPRWNGSEWVEGATDEEIQAWQEENKVIQTPTTEELLLKEIANLKIEIMQLKGGNV